ncbi:MAG TPA: hypothetical protein VH418_10655 [Solirubrobacteraceae bacterium]
MRVFALFFVLLAAYAATLGIRAAPGQRYDDDEAHHLLAAESIVSDGDADLSDQYGSRAFSRFYRGVLRPDALPVDGRLHEPQGVGVAVLVAPAYALGGARGAEWLMAVLCALAFTLAALLARRIVPEPWASGGAALVGLSAPVLAAATTVGTGPPAALLLAVACLCALRCREHPQRRFALGGAAAVAALPWLGPALVVPALPVAFALVSWTRRRRRALGLVAAEAMLASLIVYVTVNERLYDGVSPVAARLGPVPSFPGDYVDRLPNLIATWLDRAEGLLRWAPALALGFYAGWLLYRSRRAQLARVTAERGAAEAAAALLLAVCAAQLLVVTFWWSGLRGDWFPGAHFVPALPAAAALVAWGLRHVSRVVAVLLAALTLAGSAWLVGAARGSGWLAAHTEAPWGPVARVFPDFVAEPRWAAAVTVAVVAFLAALAVREWRARRALGAAA